MNIGESSRRLAFNALDLVKGGKLNKLKTVTKRKIIEGITDEYQDRRIKALLRYAKKHSDFYKNVTGTDSLSDFPVVTKADYMECYEDIMSDEYKDRRDELAKFSTSGSTGTPFTVYADPLKLAHYNMNYLSFMELNGFRLGMKRGEFRAWIKGKNTISKFKSFKNNLIMMEISNMGDEAMQGVCEKIKHERIQVLVMYSSALTVLCSYIRRYKVDISKWSVEMLFTMGEALPEATFKEAKEIFGLTPVRSYGNNENGFVAMTIPDRRGYVMDLYNYHVEILKLDRDERAEQDELGRIVITDLYNKAFPMIRYDTGDTGIARYYHDGNGRLHGYFKEIYGRRGSILYNTSGDPLSMHVFMNIMLNFEGTIKQIRCIQTGEKEYELMVNGKPEAVEEEILKAKYKEYLGPDALIRVEYVEEIPRLASGKTMVCENRWMKN